MDGEQPSTPRARPSSTARKSDSTGHNRAIVVAGGANGLQQLAAICSNWLYATERQIGRVQSAWKSKPQVSAERHHSARNSKNGNREPLRVSFRRFLRRIRTALRLQSGAASASGSAPTAAAAPQEIGKSLPQQCHVVRSRKPFKWWQLRISRKTSEQVPALWHQRRHGSALDAVLSNGYQYFYKHGPRWRPVNSSDQQLLALSKKQLRKCEFQKKQQEAVRRLAALEYHRPFVLKTFELPAAVPTMPLSIARGDYIITIVTTACLPWLTGTSINPLLRAAYLERYHRVRVTILFPWIPIEQQRTVYTGTVFQSREEQAAYVRQWVNNRLNISTKMRILFYDSWYDPRKGSIFPLDRSDVTEHILDEEADIAVLEEPEHLCWYHLVGPKWRTKYEKSVGIAHTNYVEYIKRDLVHGGPNTARFVFIYNWLVARANCHRVIRLSAAVQNFTNSIVCNVHGVSPQFLMDYSSQDGAKTASGDIRRGLYFIGKVLWGKGYRELCDLLLVHCQQYGFSVQSHLPAHNGSVQPCTGPASSSQNGAANGTSQGGLKSGSEGHDLWMDIYGSGFDEVEVMDFASRHRLPLRFHGKKDHADLELRKYKVFVNPSVSDVLCTTTAEAIAMGKIAVVADHPSNEFFRDNFPENCIVYDYLKPEAFSAAILQAAAAEPVPLRPEQKRLLTWEAATERFMVAADLA